MSTMRTIHGILSATRFAGSGRGHGARGFGQGTKRSLLRRTTTITGNDLE